MQEGVLTIVESSTHVELQEMPDREPSNVHRRRRSRGAT